jgi:ribosomal protein S18 acetylase RimI-like enzyme
MVPQFRPAQPADLDAVMGLMARFAAETRAPFQEDEARRALGRLAADASLGRVFVIRVEENVVGYVVLTLGYSLEFLGRDAFVDELFVVPEWRSRGIGSAALRHLEAACGELGVRALHLEVGPDNHPAVGLYRRAGFEDRRHHLMTKRLPR